MNLKTLETNGSSYRVDLEKPVDISIPLSEGPNNPNCYGAEDPRFEVIRIGSFVGSVKEGGSVNYKNLIITPHGNGTHTECFGHISPDPQGTISSTLRSFFGLAQVITVAPEEKMGDLVIEASAFPDSLPDELQALIIRTAPNPSNKQTMKYTGTNPPYFHHEFISKAVDHGIEHFLTDLPSVDREEDAGKLLSHRAFWRSPERNHCTITELIYVPDDIDDGLYFLNLQVPNIATDAVPSRPVLFPVIKL